MVINSHPLYQLSYQGISAAVCSEAWGVLSINLWGDKLAAVGA